MDCCQSCGRQAPTKYVEYYQNIGMLVLRSMRSIRGNLCRRCAKKHFLTLTGLTLVTGWWGMISLIINPFLIINNVVRYCTCLGLPDGGEGGFPVQQAVPAAQSGNQLQGGHPLASFRQDIVLRLRGGETPQQVAAYLSPRAGVSVAAAQQYVEALLQGKA